jgi:2-polyprenyl-3-methyl-5-hydroxy-6-metoxy-1,4-benzoquinol methylase
MAAAVLDIGCNDGYGTVVLAEHAREVVGVDISPAAIEVARTRPEATRIDFRPRRGRAPGLPGWCVRPRHRFQVIEHVEDADKFLGEVRRIMSPAGPSC